MVLKTILNQEDRLIPFEMKVSRFRFPPHILIESRYV